MGALLGLIFGCGLVLAASSISRKAATNSGFTVQEKFWPQYCDDVSSAIRSGMSVSESTWQASKSLPSLLQERFESSRIESEKGETFAKSLQKLSLELKSSTFTRIVHLILTAQGHNSSAISGLLNEFAQNLRADNALINEIAGKQAVTKISARVAAFAPLVVLILTSTRSSVRESFLNPTGITVVAVVFSTTAISYLAMRRISSIKVLNEH